MFVITLKSKRRRSLVIGFLSFVFFISNFSLFAGASSYYDISEDGRPPSVFSLCCCEKERQIEDQAYYTCENFEGEECPQNKSKYPTQGFNCPSSLIIKKYDK